MKNRSIIRCVTLIIFVFVLNEISISTPLMTGAVTNGATIAYIGDAEVSDYGVNGITELTKDFNQIILQSPTGTVDAVVMMGDMNRISQTMTAYQNSNAKNIPVFHVVGNHETTSISDMTAIKETYANSTIPLNPGPEGTNRTTYSFDVGNFHVVNLNEYWDGADNDAWFKYGNDGGYIPDELYNWTNNDLKGTSQPWKIVVGHEPLYPRSNHVNDSLDKDPVNRDKLQNLFVARNVTVFLGGHTHFGGIQLFGNVYHAQTGVIGLKTMAGYDNFSSIIYTYTNSNNDLVLTWKREDPDWSITKSTEVTIVSIEKPRGTISGRVGIV